MKRYLYPTQVHVVHKLECFSVGDLVRTIMGEYGIILGQGPHEIYYKDMSNYYKVLIDGNIYHYIAGALKKIKT